MSFVENCDAPMRARQTGGARERRYDPACVSELIEALSQHPGGLRRWSVMRAIRRARENANREIPMKFEDEVERTFRKFCAEGEFATTPTAAETDGVFFRPKDKAGEVWALVPERAQMWLADNDNAKSSESSDNQD